MTISDLLALTGIILAIIAFLNKEDRAFIKNKFTNINFLALAIGFIFINYLLFFEWWYSKIDFIEIFIFEGFPMPSTWAYIISISTIIWILYKIFIVRFPKLNYPALKSHYLDLFAKKDFSRILKYILTYNSNELEMYLRGTINPFNEFLFKDVILNNKFLIETSAYNFELERKIYEFDSEYDLSNFYTKFACTQLNTIDSYLNNLVEDDTKKNHIDDIILFEKIKKDKFINCIILNLNNKITPIRNLITIVESFYLKQKLTDLADCSKLNDSVLRYVVKSNDKELLEYFLNYYRKLIKTFYEFPSNQIFLFENLILGINDFIEESLNLVNILALETLHIGISLYSQDHLREFIKDSMTLKLKIENYRNLRELLYKTWKSNFKGDQYLHFKENVINIISNY